MITHRKLRILALLLITSGLLGLIPLNYYALKNKIALAHGSTIETVKLQPSSHLVSGRPSTLSIPSLNMNLQVTDGIYNPKNGQWTLSLDKAHFAAPSVVPNNETGNTLIYGHYRPEVFAYLHLIKPGAQAIINTDNGYQFSYTFESTEAMDPADTTIFSYHGKPRLTLQTCSGTFMQHRQMYYFHYDGFKKIN